MQRSPLYNSRKHSNSIFTDVIIHVPLKLVIYSEAINRVYFLRGQADNMLSRLLGKYHVFYICSTAVHCSM